MQYSRFLFVKNKIISKIILQAKACSYIHDAVIERATIIIKIHLNKNYAGDL